MARILKHTFIPHEGNDYKPHFFREKSIASILAVVVLLFVISFASSVYIKKTNMISAVLPAVLVDLTNDERIENGELALAKNDLLDQAASLKAEDMSTYGYFAHTSPEGVTPWHWFSKVGYYFIYAGENLAIDFKESADVEKAWLASPTHKANIMNNKFTEIGIATREGYYNGHPTIYVVQMFGTPSTKLNNLIKENIEPAINEVAVNLKPSNATINTQTNLIKNGSQEIKSPVVKGETVVSIDKLKTITNTDEFVSVVNTEAGEEVTPKTENQKIEYSKLSDRLIFLFPKYADKFYETFVWVILVALGLMLFIEIRRQHPKNIMYGILLIVIIFCFIYINRSMFVTSLLV